MFINEVLLYILALDIVTDFRGSRALDVSDNGLVTSVKLTREKKGIHVLQFMKALTPEQRYFSVIVRKVGK